MPGTVVETIGDHEVVLHDSITTVGPQDGDRIVVSGSHGGLTAGGYAARFPLAASFFNDAGVGKDDAGIASLELLDRAGIPCATVSAMSARIGEARETWLHGVISHVNDAAGRLGLRPGEPLRDAVVRGFSQP